MIKQQVDEIFGMTGLTEALTVPKIFQDSDPQGWSPTALAETAHEVAARREFCAAVLGEARHTLDLVTAMQGALEAGVEDQVDASLQGNAARLINLGQAAQERMATAKLSQIEPMVEVRAAKLQVDRLHAMERQLDLAHREWRATEFALDRIIRLTQLRLALSET